MLHVVTVLQFVTVCCSSVLQQCIAVMCCGRTTPHLHPHLQHTCNTLATHLQHTCNTPETYLQHIQVRYRDDYELCIYFTLQHTATHCNTLQHTATHSPHLQHTCNTPALHLQHTCNTYRCGTVTTTSRVCISLRLTGIFFFFSPFSFFFPPLFSPLFFLLMIRGRSDSRFC